MSNEIESTFRLSKVCADCPFRSDREFHLRTERIREIRDSLKEQGTFHCHKTVDYSGGEGTVVQKTQFCAGARATMENTGFTPILLRLAIMMELDIPLFDAGAQPVYSSLDEWAEQMISRNPR